MKSQSGANNEDTLYGTIQFAKNAGITERTVRFYESKGLLQPQLAGTTRIYNRQDHARLQIILRGKRLGFSLSEIKEYLDLYDADTKHTDQVLYIQRKANERTSELRTKLQDIKDSLKELEQIEFECIEWIKNKNLKAE
jgi:DNA-binding transcriptional MerR regulator